MCSLGHFEKKSKGWRNSGNRFSRLCQYDLVGAGKLYFLSTWNCSHVKCYIYTLFHLHVNLVSSIISIKNEESEAQGLSELLGVTWLVSDWVTVPTAQTRFHATLKFYFCNALDDQSLFLIHWKQSWIWALALFPASSMALNKLHIPFDLKLFICKSRPTGTPSAALTKFLWMGFSCDYVLCKYGGLLACLQTAFINLLQSLACSDACFLLPLPDSPKATLGTALPITDLFSLLGMILS